MWGEYERTNCALHRSRNARSLLISSTACDNCSSNVVYKATLFCSYTQIPVSWQNAVSMLVLNVVLGLRKHRV